MSYSVVIGAVKLPLGLLFQPHARVALGLRTGYRMQFTSGEPHGGTLVQHEIPLAFDLVVSPLRQLDLGFTAGFAGRVAQNGNGNGSYENAVLSMGVVNIGWADERQLSFWIGGRL
jgi:hypothetical protein